MNNLNESDKQQLSNMRHSAEHVLTQAMRNLGFKFLMAMGPATDDGFYFDFELVEGSIKEEDFEKIEKFIYQASQDLQVRIFLASLAAGFELR